MSQTDADQAASCEEALQLEELVDRLVAFHRRSRGAAGPEDAGLAAFRERLDGEVAAIEPLLAGEEDRQRLACLRQWLEQDLARLAPVFLARRERVLAASWAVAHPDSRLCDQGRVLLANAIGRDLQGPGWEGIVDPGSDLASLLVGLESHGETGLARQALDGYLRRSGDYGLARLLSAFRVVEALAGARRALQRHQAAGEDGERPALLAETMRECRGYLDLAEAYAEFRFPPLIIGIGVSGSGKSRFTRTLVGRLGAVRLCSDVERRRLHGIDPQAVVRESPVDIFAREATERTYRRLAECAGTLLEAGFPTCVDGTFLKREQRDLLRQQAEARGLPVLLVSFEADDVTLHRRIDKRARRHSVPVEDSLAILARQQADFEAFGDEERLHLLHLDTTADNAAETLAGLIQDHVRLI
ncbi:bifunctional aminoglycoside phosphotransferase/ATP-binding protein [Halomonas rhizosphaerae]|uniref:AAA family ATPase n=1 Tax=Halomonas rhizosphaerae TaxID=3043296 RepID=A0ABT6UY18_9GAMM|nr:bifunctional aminoglycoside phosphotransferase/ATP-binding protein [Halomonas rhizosphaerae]MDI5889879.1 AAA family ATPase [Halomonas rhizosphaerae]